MSTGHFSGSVEVEKVATAVLAPRQIDADGLEIDAQRLESPARPD